MYLNECYENVYYITLEKKTVPLKFKIKKMTFNFKYLLFAVITNVQIIFKTKK